MGARTKILIVEHDKNDLELMQYELKKGGIDYVSEVVQYEVDYANALENFIPDIILSDYSLPSFDGPTAFKLKKKLAPDIPFIFVSGNIGEENSIEYIKSGVTDYVLKDKLYTLVTKVRRALQESKEKKQKNQTEQELVQSERRLARAQQLAHMGSWELDLTTNILLLSAEACSIYGLAEDQNQLSFESWSSFNHPEEINFILKKIKWCRDSQGDCSFYHRILHKDGTVRHIYSECKLGSDKTGSPVSMYGVLRDLTQVKRTEEQIEFEKNNLEALINNTNDLMWSVDKDFKLITFNQPFLEATRLMSGKTIAKGINILTIESSTEQLKRHELFYERAFSGESFMEIEYTDAPVELWAEISYYPIRKGDEVIGTACHSRNITGRKKAEESNRFKADLLNTIAQSVIATDMNGVIIFWNNAAEKIYGWSAEEAMGKNIIDLIPTKQTKEQATEIMQELSCGRSWAGEFTVQRKDQMIFPVFVTDTPFYDQRQVLTGIIGVSSDITERKAIEKKLASNQAGLKQAQTIAHVGSWEVDLAQDAHSWSDEVYKIFGLNKGETIPSRESFMSFFHPEDLDYANEKIAEGFENFQNITFDFRFIRTDGIVRYGYNEWEFKFDKNGHPEKLFGIIQDITERKLSEIERTKMVNDLVLRNKELEQFAYIVSHNLRAPVANILGATNTLNDAGLSIENKMVLNRGLNESVTKLDNVIKDLNHILQVKRTINETKEMVRFSKLVNDIKISIANLIEEEKMIIKYDFSEMDEFFTLKTYLHSIFYNLIINSIKYCQPDVFCTLEIKSRLIKDKLELSFTDNGMGIDLQKKGDQVFGLYKRFHPNIEGKGMGLFMVKTQVETLGGKISIQSGVNKGTELKIEFER